MKIVYLSNFFNHHQKPLADALYQATKHQYWFVETMEIPESFIQTGYTQYQEPYVIRYNIDTKPFIDDIIMQADAVICGEAPSSLIKIRAKRGLLFFKDDERRYKSLFKYLKWPIYTYNSLLLNKGYLLSASAYGSRDYALSGMAPTKCFKWGYFTELREYEDIDRLINNKSCNNKITLLWACRLIGWKHPEMVVKLAKRLKEDGIGFELKIVGRGILEGTICKMIHQYDLDDVVKLMGPMKQEDLRTLMEKSDIFLATSDQNEGWGATINESMNSACAVVASHAIGAVPYLIKDKDNGLIFKSKDVNSLYKKTKWLLDHPLERKRLGRNAYLTIRDTWNANVACRNLIQLVESLNIGGTSMIEEGPCSRADIMNHNQM